MIAVDQMQFRLMAAGVCGDLGFGDDVVLPGPTLASGHPKVLRHLPKIPVQILVDEIAA